MINQFDPPRGSMYLYDDITPPTVDGSYKMTVTTNINYGTTQSAPIDRFFDIVGPRFTLDPTIVTSVFPPRNGQGSYEDALPQIVFSRRTLPWERRIDSDSNPLPKPQDNSNPPNGDIPWVALLLFEEGEFTLLQNQTLESVVPVHIFTALGSPANILCDAIEADAGLIQGLLPSREELQLLCHVRQVNVEDRELSAGSSDGFFSVVMSNRLPAPNTKCRACLVSLEQRTDLVRADPPAFEYEIGSRGNVLSLTTEVGALSLGLPVRPAKTRLVLLHSWQFTVQGPGTFRQLMQQVNIGMIGQTADNQPQLTDTGHLHFPILDRAGEKEVARGIEDPWSRGSSRAILSVRIIAPTNAGVRHSETGAEDVSYAAAFEVGRQLAAADARLAQELMRWRRESYKQAARADTITKVQAAITVDLPAALNEKLQAPIAPAVSVSAAQALASGGLPLADRYRINIAAHTVGMDPATLAKTWAIAPARAKAILGGDAATLGAVVAPVAETPRPNVTLEQVAADAAGLNHLATARATVLQTATVKLGNPTGGTK